MTTPEPPPYGTPAGEVPPPIPPQHVPVPQFPESVQYAASTGRKAGRTVDVVLSWILYVIQVLASVTVGFISLFAIFLTDSCGTSLDDPKICDGEYLSSVIFSFWIALVVLAVATPVALIVAAARKKASWPWAVGGFGLTVISTILFFAFVTG